MYEQYYGLKEKPFSLTPDPRFLFLSRHHQGALDHMLYGIRQREGFMTIVGDVGTGKTTLCRCLLDRLDKNVQVALILNPMLSDIDLLKTCIHDLNIQPARLRQKHLLPMAVAAAGASAEGGVCVAEANPSWVNHLSKKELIDVLNAFLLQQHEEGKFTVLIIDEAQNLSFEVMEQLRILSNLETEREKLLQIIFVGQLELNDKLARPELKQLSQRISIRYQITPLSKEETRSYISHRLMVAGASSRIHFSNSSLSALYDYSRGYPRLINLVCDRTLLAGFNAQVDTLEAKHVKQGIQSLLGKEDRNYFLMHFLKNRLPLAASILFFLAGLAFFWLSRSAPVQEETVVSAPAEASAPVVAPVSTAPQAAIAAPQQETAGQGSSQAAGKNYRIQVHAMSASASADESVRQLKSEGFPAYWSESDISGQTWYIVYAGPYETSEAARNDLKRLKAGGRDPILLSRSKAG